MWKAALAGIERGNEEGGSEDDPKVDCFYFYFYKCVYEVDKDTYPRGPLLRVERAETWGKVGGTNASNTPFLPFPLYLVCVWGLLAVKLHQYPGMPT